MNPRPGIILVIATIIVVAFCITAKAAPPDVAPVPSWFTEQPTTKATTPDVLVLPDVAPVPSWFTEPAVGNMVLTPTPYSEVYERVGRGEKFIVLVRPGKEFSDFTFPVRIGWTTIRCDDIPNTVAGRWECFLENGKHSMVFIEAFAAPVVVANRPFSEPTGVMTAPVRYGGMVGTSGVVALSPKYTTSTPTHIPTGRVLTVVPSGHTRTLPSQACVGFV